MGHDRTFPLRILKSSWGIAIDLTARAIVGPTAAPGAAAIGSRTWLDTSDVKLPNVDVDQLLVGLSYVSADIERKCDDASVTVKIIRVAYTPTDYQPEGMAAAIIGWASEEFELDPPPRIRTSYDASIDRYVIALDPDRSA